MWCIEHPVGLSLLVKTIHVAMSSTPHNVTVNKKIIIDQLQIAIEF